MPLFLLYRYTDVYGNIQCQQKSRTHGNKDHFELLNGNILRVLEQNQFLNDRLDRLERCDDFVRRDKAKEVSVIPESRAPSYTNLFPSLEIINEVQKVRACQCIPKGDKCCTTIKCGCNGECGQKCRCKITRKKCLSKKVYK